MLVIVPGYRVICTRQEPFNAPHLDAHIVSVGTGETTQGYSQLWTVAEVYTAMDRGDTFYTQSPSTGARARVGKWGCRTCNGATLRSSSDAVKDNNLDSLPRCN